MKRGTGLTLALLVGLLAGCATRDPWSTWESGVQTFVDTRGGDITLLADVGRPNIPTDPRPALARFGVLGIPTAGPPFQIRYVDALGVLVGTAQYDRQTWLVYAVATCDSPQGGAVQANKPSAIRLYAATRDSAGWHWRRAASDDRALKRYLATVPAVAPGFAVRMAFPRASDDFVLDVDGANVTVRERQSSAAWMLDLESAVPKSNANLNRL